MSTKLPPPLIRTLIEDLKIEKEAFIKIHEESDRLTSIRLNRLKPSDIFLQNEVVPWCQEGRYLTDRPSFTADPLFHAGCYYVQEASSMFIAHILKKTLDLSADLKVLDLCAAPGGKSTLLSSLISQNSLLLANEIIKTRVPILTDNLNKWGPSNIFVSNNDPVEFRKLGAYFDLIVVDAPCSGSGMFRKDPSAIEEWSENAVELCSQRQQRILANALPALKQAGVLIYSTCSYSKQENEDICDWLMETFNLKSVQIPIDPEWGIVETLSDRNQAFGYRFYPHRVKGEGFFTACFINEEGTAEAQVRRARENKIDPTTLNILSTWLENPTDYRFININDEYFAIQQDQIPDQQYLSSKLYIRKSGVRLGRIMGKDLVPHHELALSLIYNKSIPRIELTREEAINYLKRDEINLAKVYLKGWALMCYKGFVLGWAKLLPNRLNNYYPKELRIINKKVV